MDNRNLIPQAIFTHMLDTEQKRSERSGRAFVLMLLDCGKLEAFAGRRFSPEKLVSAIHACSRETDINGWYRDGAVLGTIYTEMDSTVETSIINVLARRIEKAFEVEDCREFVRFRVFPNDWYGQPTGGVMTTVKAPVQSKSRLALKRTMDVVLSSIALVVASPLMLGIAVAIKATSKGPIFYSQERLGLFGHKFRFWKFRSMYANNDPRIHEEYVSSYIAGKGSTHQGVYKLTADPRVTSIGRFLRRTSLDELPQFFNVLLGDMSLVGPRPPVLYEVDRYQFWHKRRLTVKPGITGKWQVEGRCRVEFDEMVRMDLRYAAKLSIWQDVKLMIRTPQAMISGSGAH